jgi:hypothetical protein
MEKARVITAPRQDDCRVVVLGVVLWPSKLDLIAMVESDRKEIVEPYWEEDQADMFSLQDDLGTTYERGGAGAVGTWDESHVKQWTVSFETPVPEKASTLTVSHIAGSVVLDL